MFILKSTCSTKNPHSLSASNLVQAFACASWKVKSISGVGYNVNIDMHVPDEDGPNDFWTRIKYVCAAASVASWTIPSRAATALEVVEMEHDSFWPGNTSTSRSWAAMNSVTTGWHGTMKLADCRLEKERIPPKENTLTDDFRKLEIKYLTLFSVNRNVATWKIYEQCEREYL